MARTLLIFVFSFFIIISCTKKEPQKEINLEPDEIGKKYFQEGIIAMEEGDFFFASKKFSDAETNFLNIEMAAKSSILSSYSFYKINFYNESSQNLKRFLRTYPASKYPIKIIINNNFIWANIRWKKRLKTNKGK